MSLPNSIEWYRLLRKDFGSRTIMRDLTKLSASTSNSLLSVKDLGVYVRQADSKRLLVGKLTFQVDVGKFTALIGRSGIGKSVTMKAILGLLDSQYWSVEGEIVFERDSFFCPKSEEVCPLFKDERPILIDGKYDREVISELRGKKIHAILQGPDSHLNPSLSIRWQLGEVVDPFHPLRHDSEVEAGLYEVGLHRSDERKYAHQFSQGQRQRIMTAMALGDADLIIADEPTSALDVETKKEILELIRELREEGKIKSMLLLTHDLEAIETLLYDDDRIIVMDVLEAGGVGVVGDYRKGDVFGSSPYLAQSVESMSEWLEAPHSSLRPQNRFHPLLAEEDYRWFKGRNHKKKKENPILRVEGLQQSYRQGIFGKLKIVLANVDLEIREGEVIGIAGKSGCGKTTLIKSITRLLDNTSGNILYWPPHQSTPVNLAIIQPNGLRADSDDMRRLRKEIQVIFQDSASIFNPRLTIRELLKETLDILGEDSENGRLKKMQDCLVEIGICRDEKELESILSKYPSELSGGERQRLAIVRILLMKPRLIFADEPIAEQDRITRTEILRMIQMTNQNGTAVVIVSHDPNMLEAICDRVAILENGMISRVLKTGDRRTN
jgi:ABC-type glutathione transport system ATPase component